MKFLERLRQVRDVVSGRRRKVDPANVPARPQFVVWHPDHPFAEQMVTVIGGRDCMTAFYGRDELELPLIVMNKDGRRAVCKRFHMMPVNPVGGNA